MEFTYDFNLIGELLIPLENTLTTENKEDQYHDLTTIFNKTIFDFRSIVFQNEIIRMFIYIKMEKIYGGLEATPLSNITELLKDIDIKLELCYHNDNSPQFDIKEQVKFITNSHYELLPLIKRKIFIKENNIAIIEITKKILIPNRYLDNSLMLKLDLLKKENINDINRIPLNQIIACDYYHNKRPNNIIKTVFKEIKVVHPFDVLICDQIFFTPDKSILQITIENTTSTINYIDNSLKRSKCISKNNKEDIDYLSYCFPIEINHLEIKSYETRERNPTISSDSLNKILNTMTISIINSLPIKISPGEISNIILEFNRNNSLYDYLTSNNHIETIKDNSDIRSTNSFFSVFSLLNKTNDNFNQNTVANVKKQKSLDLMTPINISIKCNDDLYKGLFISLNALWKYEYNDSMYINFTFADRELIINKMFSMKMIIKNITNALMDISIEMSSSFDDMKIVKQKSDGVQLKLNDTFPSFITENKTYSIGKIEPNQQKEIYIRLLAVKTGLHTLQDFDIIDVASNKKYSVLNTNTIFIKEK